MLNSPRFRQEVEPSAPLRRAQHIGAMQVGTTDTDVFTADVDYDFLVVSLWASNLTAADERLTLYLKPSGGLTADANALLKGYCVAGNDVAVLCSPGHLQVRLQPGMTLVAKVAGTANSVNIGGWGYDFLGGDV